MYGQLRKVLALFMALFSTAVFSQEQTDSSSTGNLVIQINEIENDGAGTIYIMVFDENGEFPSNHETAVQRTKVEEFDSSATHIFNDVEYGNYAVLVFQDLNENQKMDFSRFPRRPKEPIGFSNHENRQRPNFENSHFEFVSDGQVIEMKFTL